METYTENSSETIEHSTKLDIPPNTRSENKTNNECFESRDNLRAEYSRVLCDIRNMRELTNAHRESLQRFSNDQLLQIIEIYNLVVQNINYVFS